MYTLNVQSTILMQYTSCQIQQIAPHSPMALHYVCSEKIACVCSPGAVNKHSGADQAINNSSKSIHCFRSTEGRGVISLAVELKYQKPSARITNCMFKWVQRFHLLKSSPKTQSMYEPWITFKWAQRILLYCRPPSCTLKLPLRR